MLTKRVEVLFDPEDYRAIEELAPSQGKTVDSMVHQAVKHQYLSPSMEQRHL